MRGVMEETVCVRWLQVLAWPKTLKHMLGLYLTLKHMSVRIGIGYHQSPGTSRAVERPHMTPEALVVCE